MNQDDVLDAVIQALKDSTAFSGGSFRKDEIDLDDSQARVEQPFVEVKVVSDTRVDSFDTDRTAFVENAAGDRTGRVFEETRDLSIELHVVFAAGNADFDAFELGTDVADVLAPFDDAIDAGVRRELPDPDGGTVDDVASFRVLDGTPDADLGGVGVRRHRRELRVEYVRETLRTSGETITTIETSDPESAGSN
jgi:hypothetical protein